MHSYLNNWPRPSVDITGNLWCLLGIFIGIALVILLA